MFYSVKKLMNLVNTFTVSNTTWAQMRMGRIKYIWIVVSSNWTRRCRNSDKSTIEMPSGTSWIGSNPYRQTLKWFNIMWINFAKTLVIDLPKNFSIWIILLKMKPPSKENNIVFIRCILFDIYWEKRKLISYIKNMLTFSDELCIIRISVRNRVLRHFQNITNRSTSGTT